MAELYRPKNLAERIVKARQFEVPVAGFTFICIRPSELEWYDKIVGNGSTARFLPFIVDWSGVKESDTLPGGEPHEIAFDAAACAAWLSDRADIYGKIIGAINEAFKAHSAQREEDAKNSVPG